MSKISKIKKWILIKKLIRKIKNNETLNPKIKIWKQKKLLFKKYFLCRKKILSKIKKNIFFNSLNKNSISVKNLINFFIIEKTIIQNNKIMEFETINQLTNEIDYYSRFFLNEKTNLIFLEIQKIIYKMIFNFSKNKRIFSKEVEFFENFLNFNKTLLEKNNINSCYVYYTAQILTNFIFLSFNSNLIDKSYIDNNTIYFNRYECLDKFVHNFNMYLLFYNESYYGLLKDIKTIKHFCFTLFNLLVEWKILSVVSKKIKTKENTKNKETKENTKNKETKENTKNKETKTSIKTIIFYKFKNFVFQDNDLDFNIFKIKPKITILKKTYFVGGLHFFSLTQLFKINTRSNKSFEFNNMELVDKLISLEYKIDWEYYNTLYTLICNDLNFLEKDNMNIKEFILNKLKTHHLNNIDNLLLDDINTSEEELEDRKKIFQQTYSKYIIYYIFHEISIKLKNIKHFYLAINFDFRGRMYAKSCISPIGPKIFRYLYYYGFYSNEELELIHIKNIENHNIINSLKNCLFLKTYENINLNDKIHLTYFYWCVFEIGKIFKNELSEEKNGFFSEEELINFSCLMIEKIINNVITLNIDQQIEYHYILSGLKYLNKGKFKKLIVYKDATASGLQLLSVILDAKDNNIYKNCNLDSKTHWYDTYLYIINIFKEMFKEKLIHIVNLDKYIKRNLLKPIIMTFIYGCGKKLAEKNYLSNLPLNLNKDIGKEIINLFYIFLINFFKSEKNEFFKTPFKSLMDEGKKYFNEDKNLFLKTSDNSTIHLIYYSIIKYRLDRIIKNKRNTITFSELTDYPDFNKTWISFLANLTQGLDAFYARLILIELSKPIICIHDSFGIDILNIDILIYLANISINRISYTFNYSNFKEKNTNIKQFYSNFILF